MEYDHVVESVSDLVDPDGEPNAKKKKSSKGTHTQYTPEDHAQIGRYALENGKERARRKFSTQFPKLKESTVQNFKKTYKEELEQKKKLHPDPVTSIERQSA